MTGGASPPRAAGPLRGHIVPPAARCARLVKTITVRHTLGYVPNRRPLVSSSDDDQCSHGRPRRRAGREQDPQPLAKRFTLAHVWADLARLAGEELPPAALAIVGPALDVPYEPVQRGGYAEHAIQFAPAD